MKGSIRTRSALRSWVLLAFAVTIAGGCAKSGTENTDITLAIFAGLAHAVPHKAKPEKKLDHILRISAKKPDAGFTIRPNRELWRPFRLEASLGLPDANHADLGTNGSFSVAVVNAQQFIYYTFDVTRSAAGIVVTANAPGAAPVGTLAIPDGSAADVAVDATASTVVFYARKYGDPAYTTLGSVPVGIAGPYQISLDASGLPKGTVIGYDLFHVTTNGLPPSPTAAQTARETIYTAVDAMAEAAYAIDGAAPDRAKAGDQIDVAVARLDAALAMNLAPYKNVQKQVASARKKTAKLAAGARGKKSASSVIAALLGIAKLTGHAADAVN